MSHDYHHSIPYLFSYQDMFSRMRECYYHLLLQHDAFTNIGFIFIHHFFTRGDEAFAEIVKHQGAAVALMLSQQNIVASARADGASRRSSPSAMASAGTRHRTVRVTVCPRRR